MHCLRAVGSTSVAIRARLPNRPGGTEMKNIRPRRGAGNVSCQCPRGGFANNCTDQIYGSYRLPSFSDGFRSASHLVQRLCSCGLFCWEKGSSSTARWASAGLRTESRHCALELLLSSQAHWRAEIWEPWPSVVIPDTNRHGT